MATKLQTTKPKSQVWLHQTKKLPYTAQKQQNEEVTLEWGIYVKTIYQIRVNF